MPAIPSAAVDSRGQHLTGNRDGPLYGGTRCRSIGCCPDRDALNDVIVK